MPGRLLKCLVPSSLGAHGARGDGEIIQPHQSEPLQFDEIPIDNTRPPPLLTQQPQYNNPLLQLTRHIQYNNVFSLIFLQDIQLL